MASVDISAKILEKSKDFLMKSLQDISVVEILTYFSELRGVDLVGLLEDEKKVFWINVYNGLVQRELRQMDSEKIDKSIFVKKVIEIGGEELTLDNIEHGILRGNYWKYGLGFVPGGYLNKNTKNWKCKMLDPRIHFQVNCGAVSCPIIRPLVLENLNQDLELGVQEFILSETKVDDSAQKFEVSGLFLFYLKDFGGLKGIKRMLNKHFPNKPYKINFSSYDWTKSPTKTK